MWPAFPTSDYYGGSVPTRCPQRASRLPTATLDRMAGGQHRVGSHVHWHPFDRVGVQLCPDGIALPAYRRVGKGLRPPISLERSERCTHLMQVLQHRSTAHPPGLTGR